MTFDPRVAAHAVGQMATDHEPQATAAEATGDRSVGLNKGLENAPLLFRAQPDAGILDFQPEHDTAGVFGFQFQAHPDVAALGKLDGIADVVDEDLRNAQGIADGLLGNRGVDGPVNAQPFGGGPVADHGQGVVDDGSR